MIVQPTRRDCKLREIIVWQMSDVRRNRMQVKRHGSDVIISRHLLLYTSIHAAAELVKAMCYKPEIRGFDTRWGHWAALWS